MNNYLFRGKLADGTVVYVDRAGQEYFPYAKERNNTKEGPSN